MSLLMDGKLRAADAGGLLPSPGPAATGRPAAADNQRSGRRARYRAEMALSGLLVQGRELFQPA